MLNIPIRMSQIQEQQANIAQEKTEGKIFTGPKTLDYTEDIKQYDSLGQYILMRLKERGDNVVFVSITYKS